MIDIIDPDQPYDAAQYAADARHVAHALTNRRVLPLVVGGTGLYIKALLYGMFETPPTDPQVRETLQQAAESDGLPALHQRLQTCDPTSAARIHPHDRYRIIRSLEVYEITGKPLSEHHREHGFRQSAFDACILGLQMARDRLYSRINRRVDQMMAAGFLTEVRHLLDRGYHGELKSMQSLGYRHMVAHLNGDLSFKEAVTTMKRDTRRYTKRQYTWFGADPNLKWIAADDRDRICQEIEDFVSGEGRCASAHSS
jgi:tRNA dimethylallyltransferase